MLLWSLHSLGIITQVYLWDRIEPCASIIAACLPTYGPLFRGNTFIKTLILSATSFFSLKRSTQSSDSKQKGSDISSTEDTEPLDSDKVRDRFYEDDSVAKGPVAINENEKDLYRQTDRINVTSRIDLEYSRPWLLQNFRVTHAPCFSWMVWVTARWSEKTGIRLARFTDWEGREMLIWVILDDLREKSSHLLNFLSAKHYRFIGIDDISIIL